MSDKHIAKSYLGQIWYSVHGAVLDETGHEHRPEAIRRIQLIETALRGVWCFALVKSMTQEAGGPEVWENFVRFPDAKIRKLKLGELAVDPNRPVPKGIWLSLADARRIAGSRVKQAPGSRFPFRTGRLDCRHEIFKNMVAFENWLNSAPGGDIYMMDTTGSEAPVEEGVHAYLVVAPQ